MSNARGVSMLLPVSEAAVGGFYLTAKTRLRCEYRGLAPKKNPTDNPKHRLYLSGDANEVGRGGSEIAVSGDYMLATLDTESPAFGGAPDLGSFALHSAAWARDRVHLLTDDDLELLAETDSRPGVQSAVASEVARRLEAKRGEVEAIPSGAMAVGTPARELALPDGGSGISITLPPRDDGQPHPAGMGAPVPLSELMVRVNHFFAEADRGVPGECKCGTAKEDHVPTGDPLTPPDDGIAPTAAEADDIPWPPPEEVRAKAPAPDDELIAAKAEAEDALGPDFLRMTRAEPPADPWVISVATPTGPSAGSSRLFGGPTPADAIAAAKSWLATMREPVTPPPRRNRRQTPTSDDSAKIAALESEIVALKEERAAVTEVLAAAIPGEPSTLTERARKALDLLVSTAERERAGAAREDLLAAEVMALREQREEDITALARASLKFDAADARAVADIVEHRKRIAVLEAELEHVRALLPSDALPPSLSEAGKLRATKGRAALRVLAETYPATVAAEEARAALDALGADSA